MAKQQVKWLFFIPGAMLLAFGVWRLFSGDITIAGVASVIASALLLLSTERDPEFDAAVGKSVRQYLLLIPIVAALLLAEYALFKIGLFERKAHWIFFPTIVAAIAWFGLLRPIHFFFRAYKTISERLSREAE